MSRLLSKMALSASTHSTHSQPLANARLTAQNLPTASAAADWLHTAHPAPQSAAKPSTLSCAYSR